LNLKGVSLRMEVEGPKRLSINAKGPGNYLKKIQLWQSG
jgi:DNA-directed RNA polymerase alpha subunit